MALIPAHRLVLLVGMHPETQVMLCEALSASVVDSGPVESSLKGKSFASSGVQPSLPQFTLVSVEMGPHVLAKVAEAQTTGNPFTLVVIDGRSGKWEVARDLVERLWERDQTLRCIFCLPPDRASWPHRLIMSRPQQWAVLRIPFLGEEAFQLACCLSMPFSIPVETVFNGAPHSGENGCSS